ncbi:hypothetical protein HXX76_003019 [Chlamydomonas incerta]|uniref:Uncharacterized protein n=1 Tax=Chlamydomonas incerta TaxID=51695 RepID=A0A835TD60_CHLIN|nr:hypothetical protein HXX76_003019 [Chlamydomonas incerta]|eukprot:KAG2442943.1 hypothetical protein HXX76_003019 [Chlamydomonas incerta]
MQQSLRQILQTKNGTSPPPPGPPSSGGSAAKDTARVTGALALYSLFGLFVFSSVSTVIVGVIVSLQWPNPRVCCYRSPHSDVPTSDSCTCCALHRLNIGFAVTWLALLVLLVLAFIIYLMAAAAVLAIVHSAIAYRLVRQLKQSYAANMAVAQMVEARQPTGGGVVTGVVIERPLPGVPLPGIAVVDIPLLVAVVDSRLMTQIGFEQTAAAVAAAAALAGSGSNGGGGGGGSATAGAAGAAAVGAAGSVAARVGSATKRTGSAGQPLSPAGSGRVPAAAGPGSRSAAASPGGAAALGAAAGAAPMAVPVALVVDERIVPPGVGGVPQRPAPPPPGPASPGAAPLVGATRWGSGEAPLRHPSPSPAAVAAVGPSAVAAVGPSAVAGMVGGPPQDADSSYPLLQPPGAAPRVRAGPELSAEVSPQHHSSFRTSSGGGAAGGSR